MMKMDMPGRLMLVVFGAVFVALVPAACSESPYDTTAVASQKCPKDQPAQCVAMFGDPRAAGIKPSQEPNGPVITTFAPTAYFGNTPFKTELAFEVQSPADDSLSCAFDAEGDGIFEQQVDCSAKAVSVAYPVPGRYAPALRVMDSAGRVASASEIVLSNRLVAKAETVVVNDLSGVIESAVDGDVVSLTFASEGQVPPLPAGTMLFDRGVNGYVRKVTHTIKTGVQLVMQTEERSLYDAFESGYFGMRYAVAAALDNTSTQSSPGPKPQDAFGDIKFGPNTWKGSVPMPTTAKVEVSGVELEFDNPKLDIDFELMLFEVTIAGRYAFIVANSKIGFESDVSITGTVDLIKNGSVFLPIGPLGVGWSTPFGKAALGAVVEVGVDAELNMSLEWHQKLNSRFALNLIQTDPFMPESIKQMLGYPKDEASVWGPTPTFELSNGHANVELAGKLFAAPQVVINVGNAAGVMRRAKKDATIYQTECKNFKGIRAAAGFEANVLCTAALKTDASGPSFCLEFERDAKFFAELFPGFEFCPSAELSVLSDAEKDWWHQCWPLSPTCANGSQDAGETDKDCGGSCSPCANGKKCSGNNDCLTGSCQAGVCGAAGSTCPSGNGYYCGKQVLGQNTNYLYYCQNGSYSLSSTCNGQGCQVNPPGFNDSCANSCVCSAGTCCSNGCNYDVSGTACGTCKICNGAGSCNNASNGTACPGGSCQNGVCISSCACGGGTCCSDGCNYDGFGTSCGTCKICDGFGSCGNANNGTACPGGTCQNGVCSANCGAATYWSPSSISDVDIDGTQYSNGNPVALPSTQMKIEISESATPGNLRLRVCKIDGQNPNLINSVHVYFKDSSNMVMFDGTLGTNGTPCSNYGEMSNESNYTNGEVLGGSYRVVSPTGSAVEWTYNCTKAGAADASGTCWWDPAVPTTTRTCK